MRKYRNDASSTTRIEYGIELHAGLSQCDETLSAAADLLSINEALANQLRSRLALRAPELKTRAVLRFAEYDVDKVIRSAARAAEIEDGGRRGRIFVALFPKGLSPVVKPTGRAQVKPTRDLIDRLRLTKVSGIDGYRAVWQPKLESALARLEDAVNANDVAAAMSDDAFKAEMALRDAHVVMVERVMGMVRAAFPGDRELQDIMFPVVADGSPRKTSALADEADQAPTNGVTTEVVTPAPSQNHG